MLIEQNIDDDNVLDEMIALATKDSDYCEVLLVKAEKLLHEGNPSEAAKILLEHYEKCSVSDSKDGYYALLIESLIHANEIDEAKKYSDRFFEDEPNNFYANYLKIRLSGAKNEEIKMSEIDALKTLITTDSPIALSYKLAELYFANDNAKSAAEVIEPTVANTTTFSPLVKMLLGCYYNTGNHAKGIPLAEKFFTTNPSNPYLADYLSVVYEILEDYSNAIRVADAFLKHVPNDITFKVKKAINFCKNNQFQKGIEILDEITKQIDTLPLEVQFFIANAYLMVDRYFEGMEIGYDARMRNYSNPIVHESYLRLITATKSKEHEFYYPDTVQENCFVILEDVDGKRIDYVIVKQPKYTHEIGLNETITVELLGKKINETIEINGDNYTVKAIMLKYTYANHDSMNQISMRFADQTQSMKIVKINPNATTPEEVLAPILNSIDTFYDFEKSVAELYPKIQATIGSNAQLLVQSPIEYLGKITSDWEFGCYSIGSPDEFRGAIGLLKNNTPIAVDIVSLLTLFHINGFELLKHLTNKVYTSKSPLSLIKQKIDSGDSNLASASFSIGKKGKQYYKYEITQEEKQKHANALQELYELTIKYCEIADAIYSSAYDEKKKLDKVLGESFHDTALLCTKEKCILYSDDRNFRILSFNDLGIPGMSTFTLLQYLLTTGGINVDSYNGYMVELVKHNYRQLPVNEEILYEVLKYSNYKVGQPFINSTDIILLLNDAGAVKLCVDFLYKIYTEMIPLSRDQIVRFILERLFENRNSFIAKRFFLVYLNTKFTLLPMQRDEILQYL